MSALESNPGTSYEAGAYSLATLPPCIVNSCSGLEPSAGLNTTSSSDPTTSQEHLSCTYTDSNPYASTDGSMLAATTPPPTASSVTQRDCTCQYFPRWLRKVRLELQPCPSPVRLTLLKRPMKAIKTVVSSFGKMTIVLSMVLATIYSIPAWKGLQLQAWTSQKDFLEYCQSEMVSHQHLAKYIVD